ncbi:OLC1v1016732C2 [Oldenlandia corymbosa var. corymbosa]|nr:OLC1v1016732C2 [Oldenlandia corymbosa var. corymbosa]
MAVSKEKLKGLFKQYDKNGDGLLDKSELKEAFKRLGAILPGWRASRSLQHADANGDGVISEDELVELVKYALQFGYTVK